MTIVAFSYMAIISMLAFIITGVIEINQVNEELN